MKILILITVIHLLIMSSISYAQSNTSDIMKTTTNDDYNFISVNEIKMWVSNNGDGSYNPLTRNCGFFWPGGDSASKSLTFSEGLLWGGKIDGKIKVNGTTHRNGLQAGKILATGIADNPSLSKYKIYKIRKNWESFPLGFVRDEYESSYKNWPVTDGAPWLDLYNDGVYNEGIDLPKHIGDETLWYISNDLDTSRSLFTYGSEPIGLEFQTTVYAFDSSNYLNDVVFKRYLIINKSGKTIDSMYLSYWSDDDLGDPADDYPGCDITFNLGYCFNGDDNDYNGTGSTYGSAPPAVGHMLLQGPIVKASVLDSAFFKNKWIKGFSNLPMTSFGIYWNAHHLFRLPHQGNYTGTIEWYNNIMKGLKADGDPYINPQNAQVTLFPLSGDPVSHTGWYCGEGWPTGPHPGNIFSAINSGPFTFAPNDTQEVVIAVFAAKGSSNINSITVLLEKARQIRYFHSSLVQMDNDLPQPSQYFLLQNFPNPFNPSTTIWYEIPIEGLVTLKVYDILGNEITTLINDQKPAGRYSIKFNGNNLASSIYFYQLQAGDFVQTRKMLMLK